jgi:hypothetical protein
MLIYAYFGTDHLHQVSEAAHEKILVESISSDEVHEKILVEPFSRLVQFDASN